MYSNPYSSSYHWDPYSYNLFPHPTVSENLSTNNMITTTPGVVIPTINKKYELQSYCQSIQDDSQKLISVDCIFENISSCNSKTLTKYLYHKSKIFDNAQCHDDLYIMIQNNSTNMIKFFPEFVRLASMILQEYYYYTLVYRPLFQNYWRDNTTIDVFNALHILSGNLIPKERANGYVFLFDTILNIGIILLKLFLKYDNEKIGKELIENIYNKECNEINLELIIQKLAELIVLEAPGFTEQEHSIVHKHLKNRIKLKDVLILIYMMNQIKKH